MAGLLRKLGTTVRDAVVRSTQMQNGMFSEITLTPGGTTTSPTDVEYRWIVTPTEDGATISAITNSNSPDTPNALAGKKVIGGMKIPGLFKNVTITDGVLILYKEFPDNSLGF